MTLLLCTFSKKNFFLHTNSCIFLFFHKTLKNFLKNGSFCRVCKLIITLYSFKFIAMLTVNAVTVHKYA